MSKTSTSASATGLPSDNMTEENSRQRLKLTEIKYRLDAITAAVRGSDFNDHSQQRGIIHLLGEQYCKLGEVIDEMGGPEEYRDEE